MEMHQVRYFLAVAETLNFTRAAERCSVSPPSLIRAIKLLESEFGGPLFRRERSRTHLTELGRIALPYLEQIAAAAHSAKTEASRALILEQVVLRLGIMCTIAPLHFLTLIADFRTKYPDVQLSIVDEDARTLEELLLTGQLDMAIYALPGKKPNRRLHAKMLFSEEMVIILSEANPLAQRATLSPADLAGEPYIERINCEFGEFGESVFSERQIYGPTICRSERDDWVLGMVAQNLGYSFMPISSSRHDGVVARRVDEMPLSRTVNLVTVRGRQHSPAAGAFVRQIARATWPTTAPP